MFQNALLFYCALYTYFLGGRTDAVARHVSFAQITCLDSVTIIFLLFRFFLDELFVHLYLHLHGAILPEQ